MESISTLAVGVNEIKIMVHEDLTRSQGIIQPKQYEVGNKRRSSELKVTNLGEIDPKKEKRYS